MATREMVIRYEEFNTADELPEGESDLVKAAWEARKGNYSQYSKFQVGSAILTRDGTIYGGSNQEVANFKVTCAERAAIIHASIHGQRDNIRKIAIVGGPEGMDINLRPSEPEEPLSPCGQCRQDLREVEGCTGEEVVIICVSRNRVRRFLGIESLLPFSFGPDNLR